MLNIVYKTPVNDRASEGKDSQGVASVSTSNKFWLAQKYRACPHIFVYNILNCNIAYCNSMKIVYLFIIPSTSSAYTKDTCYN